MQGKGEARREDRELSEDVVVHDVTVHSAIACPFSHRTRMARDVAGAVGG
jgi:hypothetical protein